MLVNNAGMGGNAVVEEATPAQVLEVTNVNVCGALRCLQAVLPGMREQRQGTIVNISSVVGRFGAIAQAPYVASKWALEGLSEQLALELAPFGIRVIILEPGITKSAIFAKNVDAPNSTDAYDEHYQRMFEFYAAGIAQATDPFEVAAVVYDAITTDTPKLRYVCSWGGPEIVAGRQVMPDEDWVALARRPTGAPTGNASRPRSASTSALRAEYRCWQDSCVEGLFCHFHRPAVRSIIKP